MKWLVAALVALGAAAVVFRWRKPKAESSAWTQVTEKTSSAAKTAAEGVKSAVPH
jgi:hypothetical protein